MGVLSEEEIACLIKSIHEADSADNPCPAKTIGDVPGESGYSKLPELADKELTEREKYYYRLFDRLPPEEFDKLIKEMRGLFDAAESLVNILKPVIAEPETPKACPDGSGKD